VFLPLVSKFKPHYCLLSSASASGSVKREEKTIYKTDKSNSSNNNNDNNNNNNKKVTRILTSQKVIVSQNFSPLCFVTFNNKLLQIIAEQKKMNQNIC